MEDRNIREDIYKMNWVVNPSGYSALDIGVVDDEDKDIRFVIAAMNSNFYESGCVTAQVICNAVNSTVIAGYDPVKMREFMEAFGEWHVKIEGVCPKGWLNLIDLFTQAKLDK